MMAMSTPKIMLALSSRMSSMYLGPKIGMNASFYDGQSYGSAAGSSGSKASSVPKCPTKIFIRFANEVRPQILMNNPGISCPKVSTILSQQWKELSEDKVKVCLDCLLFLES
jgi:hypothetical protein